MTESRKKRIIYFCTWLGFGLLYFTLFYSINTRKGISDYYLHNLFSELFFQGEMQIMYPGYHILVGGITFLTHLPVNLVSSFVLCIASLVSIGVAQRILCIFELSVGKGQLLWLAFIINFIQPIFTFANRPGASSGNGYISPTYILCKPFIFLTIYFFYIQYNEKVWTVKNQSLLLCVLILSCVVKPIFAMAFVPAIGLLLLLDVMKEVKKSGFNHCVKCYLQEIWPIFLTGVFLLMQYAYMKTITIPEGVVAGGTDGSSNICFGFLYAWKMQVQNVGLSIIYAYFTPIVVFLYVFIKKYKLSKYVINYLKMNLAFGMVSFAYISCLYQDKYAGDLNFRNGWIANFLITYVITLVVIVKIWNEINSKKEKLILLSPLSIQMLFGVLLVLRYLI